MSSKAADSTISSQIITTRVEASAAGMRLDKWLAERLAGRSRAQVQRWIADGRVRVNQRRQKMSYRLVPGDEIQVSLPDEPSQPVLQPEAIPLEIVWEDADYIVINKAAGMAVHPGAGRPSGTVVNALLHYLPSIRNVGAEDRPGIVHRLDMDTSGAMIVAKHDAALHHMQRQFQQRTVYKEYLTLLDGRLDPRQGRIDVAIMRKPGRPYRQAVADSAESAHQRSRRAITEYTVVAEYTVPLRADNAFGSFSYVRAHPITGRTHQLRVHFAWLGHPIVGDPIYGLRKQRISTIQFTSNWMCSMPRMFLHAHRLRFRLLDGSTKEVEIPLPDDLREVLELLAIRSSTDG